MLLARWPIRNKLLLGVALLLVMVLTLSASTFYGRYAYRGLVKSLGRLDELRLVNELVRRVNELRLTACQLSRWRERRSPFVLNESARIDDIFDLRDTFRQQLGDVREVLIRYQDQLEINAEIHLRIGGGQRERSTVREITAAVARLEAYRDYECLLNDAKTSPLRRESEQLQLLTGKLPSYLRRNILGFTDTVRGYYRTFLFLAYLSLLLTAVLLCVLMRLVYRNVFRPLRILAEGSRKVASGCFDHRIDLKGEDEMAELAVAMNDMTCRFLAERDHLDRKVQERTRQFVQTERLASVGYLAAGVSHEINNPLAAIAMSAESLERRLRTTPLAEMENDMRNYLRMIANEASRCQGITAKLLDFSRMCDARREPTELGRLIQDVVEVLRHVEKYDGKEIEFEHAVEVVAVVNVEEMKQVILNLLTNALDSIEMDGQVKISLRRREDHAEIVVRDDGCGMTEEVLEHLFEPFFTRRSSGRGTGLGLSIVDRIVADQGGQIDAASEGPGRGSQFRVRLPLKDEPPATSSSPGLAA